MRVNGVAVILTDEEDRQLLQRCEIQALREDPLLRRAVAEEAGNDRLLPLNTQGIGVADGIRNGGADHGRGAHHAGLQADQVHRAALAASAAGRLAVQLRQHRLQPAALGQVESMTAIGAEDHIVGPQGFTHTDRHRLLPN